MMPKLKRIFETQDERVCALRGVHGALEAGDYPAAISACLQVLDSDSTCVPALLSLATAVQLAGETDVRELSLDDVSEILRRAAGCQAMTDDAGYEYARFLYAVQDDSHAAYAVLEAAIVSRSDQLRKLLLARLEVLYDLGRREEMLELLGEALRTYPDAADLLAFRAAHLSELQQSPE